MSSLKQETGILQSLLEDIDGKTGQEAAKGNQPADLNIDLGEAPPITIDPEFLRSECMKQAKDIVSKTIKTLIPKGSDINIPYIQSKMRIDADVLGSIIYQWRLAEKVQTTIIRDISSGYASPKIYAAFNESSKQVSELSKRVLQSIEVIKQTILGMISQLQELDVIRALPDGNGKQLQNGRIDITPVDKKVSFSDDGSTQMSGTKSFIEQMTRQSLQSSDSVDI